MTAVFLQVRLDSSRLPRKALLTLAGKTVTEHCLSALWLVPADVHVLVTEPDSLSALEPLAQAAGWEIFAGSKDNVLDRFVQAGRRWGASTIIRATGDNPLVSYELATELLARHRQKQADYSGFQGGPLGSGVEIVELSALEAAYAGQPDAYETEHVSPYLYRRPEIFILNRPMVGPELYLPEARITLDTAEDFRRLEQIFAALYRGRPIALGDLTAWLRQNPASSLSPTS